MAGNSQRRGRSDGAGKKTASAGTGGKNRRSLAGRGATPPAEQRYGHPAARRAADEARQRADRARARQRSAEQPELLLGRNPVVEALRARIPATALYVVTGDTTRPGADERITEALGLDPLDERWSTAGADGRLAQATDGLVSLALEQRQAARARKDFAAADAIRDQLTNLGVTVEDTPDGPRWELSR